MTAPILSATRIVGTRRFEIRLHDSCTGGYWLDVVDVDASVIYRLGISPSGDLVKIADAIPYRALVAAAGVLERAYHAGTFEPRPILPGAVLA